MIPTIKNKSVPFFEIQWLEKVAAQVICTHFKQEGHENHWWQIPMPELAESDSVYAGIVREWQLGQFERVLLALAMAPHLQPEALDIFYGINLKTDRIFSEFGGITDKGFNGFLPTGQTLLFLLSANEPEWRLRAMELFNPRHRLMAEQVISLESIDPNLPRLSGLLKLSEQWLHYFLTGEEVKPELSTSFPAHALTTPLTWSDLVLDYPVMMQVEEIRAWLAHGPTLMEDWGLARKVKPGYRAAFYGPPGTGKTLTAALLAQSTGREVYRVDLSMIVSKYIGETEKNLSRVFDAAAYKDWILFFDEADALFGKRTVASTANDRHANQQTGYLLQKIEDFPGTVILATNLKANMDEAFARRFQAMIHFSMPSADLRLQLWQNAFRDTCALGEDIDLVQVAEDYELSGGAIINVLRNCALTAISQERRHVTKQELLTAIRAEQRKEGKTI
ncbi:MAG: ATP-binding protein [Candidatus Electrothrix aestuarii]|uniref:ATP-binding protein n=1 Tax=Candidatus Electrothrix aestuarii TaxID=3062594 RepID=A0AAU8LVT7_9BACT|nr:ATP-binding protein [Candidatus Electrothrix aestuarii]